MKTIEINLYQFNELSDEQKKKAILNNCEINFRFDWWDWVSEGAKEIGLKLNSFDIDANYCNLSFIYCADETAAKILKEYGEQTDIFKLAADYKKECAERVAKYSDGINLEYVLEENTDQFDYEIADIEEDFLNKLEAEYLAILKDEYEYLSSDEGISETLIANEYDLTEDGKIYR